MATNGIYTYGNGCSPYFIQSRAAKKIALHCIKLISGYLTPNLHPLNPSIGLN